jgi:hypothetical protein
VKFIFFIKVLLQKLQTHASFLIVSSQKGHNFVMVQSKLIFAAKDFSITVGMPAGLSVTPRKVAPKELFFLLM